MKQCGKCLSINKTGIWVKSEKKVNGAESEDCPECSKGTQQRFRIKDAAPKFSHIEGQKLRIEFGPFQGNFYYHVWLKTGLSRTATKEILEKQFAPEYVEWVPEMESWCVTLPIDLKDSNREFYMETVPNILASI